MGSSSTLPLSAMEHLEEYNTLVLGAIGTLTLFVFYFLFRGNPEAAVPYNVTPPKEAQPGWKGEVLEEPSLKVTSALDAWQSEN
jgi:hypothetical protein